jgi:hypothetical protein
MDVRNQNRGGRTVSQPLSAADSLPPHALLAEQAVLGCALAAPTDCLGELRRAVKPEAFYDLRHRAIFEAMAQMDDRYETIELVALCQCLQDAGQLEQIGGFEYLNQVQDSVPSPANFSSYLDTLREKYFRRQLISELAEGSRQVSNERIPVDGLVLQNITECFERFGKRSTGNLPEIIDGAKFVAELISEPPQLVRGIFHKGSKLAFGGSSKSFKTWCLLDLALSVATGAPWMGFATTPGKVLIVNFEVQPFAWQRRIEAVSKAKGIILQPGQLQLWNLRGYAANFKKLIPLIIQRARQEQFDLIILDPIYKLYGGTDENSAGDMTELLNEIERLAVSAGTAVAFGAHFAKGNASVKEAIDRISGSGVFARDPDSLLMFTKHQEKGAFTVEPILRNFPLVDSFVVRWNFPLMDRAGDLDPSKLKQATGRARKYDSMELLSVIKDNSIENPISISAWARKIGIVKNTLDGYLPEMRRHGWIKTAGEGNAARQYITKEGKAFLIKSQLPEMNSGNEQ